MLRPIARYMADLLFFSRWLIAPFLLGLLCCVALVIVKFAIELFALMKEVANDSWHDLVVGILTLIDLTLIANLILVIARGVVAESGNHDELMARNGIYAELHRTQFDDVAPTKMSA